MEQDSSNIESSAKDTESPEAPNPYDEEAQYMEGIANDFETSPEEAISGNGEAGAKEEEGLESTGSSSGLEDAIYEAVENFSESEDDSGNDGWDEGFPAFEAATHNDEQASEQSPEAIETGHRTLTREIQASTIVPPTRTPARRPAQPPADSLPQPARVSEQEANALWQNYMARNRLRMAAPVTSTPEQPISNRAASRGRRPEFFHSTRSHCFAWTIARCRRVCGATDYLV